ncbi:TIGR04028 family ABC transporter substrate-binding protein [Serinibacter arcticus]|uniref:TIGR04028 family ABC transporter substrate-binding protein n=1 Tax=Serinibacter arcticus TaxID=1655435 RepID=A0A2U1ZQW8_9MICO|nr:TIGR04028 family ABC transporter substrate-binding protein [Serinibacter arcticus]PWD49394.1 TIGR04028 family ABC transporter substrate-binding protein [Serinibacter arcticus]
MSRTTPVRRSVALAAVAAATAMLAACGTAGGSSSGGDDATSGEGGSAAAGEPQTGGELLYLEYQPYTTLYPPQSGFYPNGALIANITDRLVYQDPETLEFSPWIATDWEINADATEYTFNLRSGVTFSDGTPLDAEVVAKNFDTYGLGDPEAGFPISEQINNYVSSEVVDDDTVIFRFSAPAPGFLQATTANGAGLLSSATLDGDLDSYAPGNATNVVGSGPFVITEETVGTEILLEAREDYDWAPEDSEHQGRAYLDGVRFSVTPEDSVRIGALTSGQTDVIRYVQAYDEDQVADAGLQLFAPQTQGVNNSLSLRFTNGILADINVRKAIVAGVNAQEVVDTVFTENYPVATGVLSHTALGYVDHEAELAYDPDEANRLLDEAGWTLGSDGIREKDGQKLTLVASEAKPQPLSRDTLTLVSQQLKTIGVDLQILAADSGTYAEAIKDPEQVQLYHSMVGRTDLDVIKSQYHSANRNANLSNDAELDRLLELVSSTAEPEARLAATAAAQQYLVDQAYVIPLFEEPQVYGAQPYVQGFGWDTIARPVFYSTWLEQ